MRFGRYRTPPEFEFSAKIHQTKKPRQAEHFSLVNHRASQVETLFEALEELDRELAALGVDAERMGNI